MSGTGWPGARRPPCRWTWAASSTATPPGRRMGSVTSSPNRRCSPSWAHRLPGRRLHRLARRPGREPVHRATGHHRLRSGTPLLPRPEIEARPSTGLRRPDRQGRRLQVRPRRGAAAQRVHRHRRLPRGVPLPDEGVQATVADDGTVDARSSSPVLHPVERRRRRLCAGAARSGAYRGANTDDDFVDTPIAPLAGTIRSRPGGPIAAAPRFTG